MRKACFLSLIHIYGMVWDFLFLYEQVIKNFATLIFPMCKMCIRDRSCSGVGDSKGAAVICRSDQNSYSAALRIVQDTVAYQIAQHAAQ